MRLQCLQHSLACTARCKQSGEKRQRVAQRGKGKRVPWRAEHVQHMAGGAGGAGGIGPTGGAGITEGARGAGGAGPIRYAGDASWVN